MATSTRNTTKREQDRTETAAMSLAGMSHADIAKSLGVSRQQVTYDLKVIRDRWQNRTVMDLDESKTIEVAKIDRLEQVYWDAWELQCLPRLLLDKDTGEVAHVIPQTGDPALLAGILKCIDRRCRLLGLDAPLKVEGKLLNFTIAFDTPQGPRPPEDLEALMAQVPHTNGKVVEGL